MQNRRKFVMMLTTSFVALGVVVGSVFADELSGVITKVNADAKTISVLPKGEEKEIEVKITDETVQVTKKGEVKVDLEKLAKGIEKAKEKGKKGIQAKIEHEKAVASKITVGGQPKKKKDADK